MRKIEAKFKIVTPLFMSGADQRKAELRVPSIKGALRFWWRALALGRLGSVDKVREAEAKLFGSSDQAVGQSKVLLNLTEKPKPKQKETMQKWRPNDWMNYVGYGIIDDSPKKRDYFKPGSEFKLELVLKNGVTTGDEESICNALKALGLIGGLGAHSRNGWGSLSLANLTNWDAPSDLSGYRREISSLLSHGKSVTGLPEYTAFSTRTRIELGTPRNSLEVIHQYLAEKYRDYVKSIKPKEHRKAFGLPRKPDLGTRRTSPVFLHVHCIGNEYVPVVSFFPAQFLPTMPEPSGGYRTIERFLDQFAQEGK